MLFQSNTEKTTVLCSNIKQGQYDQALRYIVVVFVLDIDDTDFGYTFFIFFQITALLNTDGAFTNVFCCRC